MRPALKSGLLPVWRDSDTLQIGIDPRRAVALSGMGRAAFIIGLLDGSRDRGQVLAAAADGGIPVLTAERILTLLAAGGALDDFPAGTLREIPAPLRMRLAAELATTSLAYGDGDGGARALARRRACVVQVEGDRRIGRSVARILSAAGIGQVRYSLGSPVAQAQYSPGRRPGGQSPGPRRPGPAARGSQPAPGTRGIALRDASPQPGSPKRQPAGRPLRQADLVILVGRALRARAEQLAGEGVPHLAATAGEAIGVVGPLVVPGRTACLRCMDYVRAGNDPAWPLILAQLTTRQAVPAACDSVLAAAVAAQVAAQALTAIDRGPIASAAVNGTLELVLPDWRWRRRTWLQYPACTCTDFSCFSAPR